MAPRHRLFFAIRPPAGLLPEIAALRDRDGTGRGRVEDHRLHLTTWLFPDHDALPPGLAERAAHAADTVERRAFRINLDIMTGDDRGVRLVPSEPIRGYADFQRDLAAALRAPGWSRAPAGASART